MIPYLEIPTLDLGPVTLSIFGALVAAGIVVGSRRASRFARARGVEPRRFDRLVTWSVVGGLACAHWVSVLGYYPDRVAADPWLLLRFFDGLSSVGGFLGGVLVFAWFTRGDPMRWTLADALMHGLVVGFTFGRLGCALVHDHPGALVDPSHPLAVGPWPDGSVRIDLGLVEFLGMCGVCALVQSRRWEAPGRLTWTVALVYGIGRFALDFLRAEDLRHLGLTTAQWATSIVVASCLVVAWRAKKVRGGL